MPVTHGRIVFCAVQFPSGCSGLAHLTVTRSGFQLFPQNAGQNFASGAETIAWPEDYEFTQPPYTLTLFGWNDDATYPHTVTVRIIMEKVTEQKNVQEEIALLLSGTVSGAGSRIAPS